MKLKLKIINKKLKYFYIGFFGAAMAVVMIYASNEVAKMFGKENQWDSMAFVGALFGGALTLIGVQMTLRNQYVMDHIKRSPSVRNSADVLLNKISTFATIVEYGGLFREYDELARAIKEAQTIEEELIKEAVNMSSRIYICTRDFLTYFIHIQYLVDRLQGKPVDQISSAFKEMTQKAFDLKERLSDEIEKEITKYDTYEAS